VSTRSRLFAVLMLLYLAGVGVLMWQLVRDIDPRYRESAEESLVEMAHLVAVFVEQNSPADTVDAEALRPIFRDLVSRNPEADIYGLRKESIELRVVVTDAAGLVVFDSFGGRREGEDWSQWRDIRRALLGQYGARTSPEIEGDPASAVMWVAAPVRSGDRIIGAAAAGKPLATLGDFIRTARRKTLVVGATAAGAALLLAIIFSVWLVRPLALVRGYVRYLRSQRHAGWSRFGARALGALRAALGEVRDAFAGRRDVADYVQTLTHELKSPLSSIRGASELLAEPSMPEADRARFIANIRRETGRIQEIVDRMMELAALESRRVLERIETVDLRALAEGCVASAAAIGAPRRIATTLEPGEPVWVEGDALLLRRALANLIDNAIDFSPEGGTVRVSITAWPRSVELRVADSGPGIPAYAGDKVFDKFFSLERPHTGRKSTGLGLPFVKEIAELHRGSASLRNGEGGGAVATIALPRADPPR
jgi:two-component system, OmpR family, sensor histidine kinase CreC